MRCPFATWLPSPNFTPGFAQPVRTRLQHTTVGTLGAALSTLRKPAGSASVSAHFVVGLHPEAGGEVPLYQLVDTDDRAWHARSANEFAFGIEHVDDGNYWDAVRTPEQYAMSAKLNTWLGEQFNLPATPDTIQRHKVYVNTACPDALDVERIIALVEGVPDMTGDNVKALIREMLTSTEGADLVSTAIGHKYGPALEGELSVRFSEVEAKAVVEALLDVKDECLKPKALAARRKALQAVRRELAQATRTRKAAMRVTVVRAKRPSADDVRAGHGR